MVNQRQFAKYGTHALLLICLPLLAWLLMQVVHELGHVIAAWATGGKVERVVLHPLMISRTDVSGSGLPLSVVWAGPVFGSLLPVAIWVLLAAFRSPFAWLARFFAGFCLLANGLYIGIGSFDRIGDAGDLMQHGSPIWTLWLFGAIAAPLGLALWNGLGKKLGIRQRRRTAKLPTCLCGRLRPGAHDRRRVAHLASRGHDIVGRINR